MITESLLNISLCTFQQYYSSRITEWVVIHYFGHMFQAHVVTFVCPFLPFSPSQLPFLHHSLTLPTISQDKMAKPSLSEFFSLINVFKILLGKRRQEIRERENVRSTTVEILENMYDSVFEHDQTHFDNSKARELSIDCQEITLQRDGSQSSPFFKPWTSKELDRYPINYDVSITNDWIQRDKRWFDDSIWDLQEASSTGCGYAW